MKAPATTPIVTCFAAIISVFLFPAFDYTVQNPQAGNEFYAQEKIGKLDSAGNPVLIIPDDTVKEKMKKLMEDIESKMAKKSGKIAVQNCYLIKSGRDYYLIGEGDSDGNSRIVRIACAYWQPYIQINNPGTGHFKFEACIGKKCEKCHLPDNTACGECMNCSANKCQCSYIGN